MSFTKPNVCKTADFCLRLHFETLFSFSIVAEPVIKKCNSALILRNREDEEGGYESCEFLSICDPYNELRMSEADYSLRRKESVT